MKARPRSAMLPSISWKKLVLIFRLTLKQIGRTARTAGPNAFDVLGSRVHCVTGALSGQWPLLRVRSDVAAQRAGGVEHVRAHAAAGLVAIALSDGRQNAIVLLARARNAAALPQLRAPECPETNPDGNRLLRQERIVGGGVDRLVERAIEVVVAVEVASLDERFRGLMQLEKMAELQGRHPMRRQPDAQRLDLGRRLEHVHDPRPRHRRDDDPPPRPRRNKPASSELAGSLPSWCPGGAEAIRQMLLVQGRPGPQVARCDLVREGISDLIGEEFTLLPDSVQRW